MEEGMGTHVFDFFDAKVRVCGDTDGFWSDVYDDHYWSCDVPLEEVVDFLI